MLSLTRPKGYLQSREGGRDMAEGGTQENRKPSTPPWLQNCEAGDPATHKKLESWMLYAKHCGFIGRQQYACNRLTKQSGG
jgi:hypothetical protein